MEIAPDHFIRALISRLLGAPSRFSLFKESVTSKARKMHVSII